MFTDGNSSEFDAAIANLMEKNRAQAKEIRNLKLEQESQAININQKYKPTPWVSPLKLPSYTQSLLELQVGKWTSERGAESEVQLLKKFNFKLINH